MNQVQALQDIKKIGKLLWSKSMVAANDGNLSVKLSDDGYLITASGISKGFLESEHILKLTQDWVLTRPSEYKVTSEYKLHRIIYNHSQARAVCHAHPPYATSFSATNSGVPSCLLPELLLSAGPIPLVPYSAPSTAGVADKMIPFLNKGYEVFLMQNHGVVTIGQDLTEAYFKMESVEHYCKIAHFTLIRGDQRILKANEIEELNRIRNDLWKKEGEIACDDCGFCNFTKEEGNAGD